MMTLTEIQNTVKQVGIVLDDSLDYYFDCELNEFNPELFNQLLCGTNLDIMGENYVELITSDYLEFYNYVGFKSEGDSVEMTIDYDSIRSELERQDALDYYSFDDDELESICEDIEHMCSERINRFMNSYFNMMK